MEVFDHSSYLTNEIGIISEVDAFVVASSCKFLKQL